MSIEEKYKKKNLNVQQHIRLEMENIKKGLSKKNLFQLSAILEELEKQRAQNRINRVNGVSTSFPPDMGRIAIDRTSASICTALYLGYAADMYSKYDLANHLGIKLDKVDVFLKEAGTWSN